MCGIFGVAGSEQPSESQLRNLAAMIRHRGPDSDGYFRTTNCALGMVRLSILDLKTGDQPFYSPDGSVAVVCNGEIYNYRELREEFSQAGHLFRSGSDIEVLPLLYQKYGKDFLSRLNGMFGLALHDSRTGSLILARDRFGVKPIYYHFNEAEMSLHFGSEIRTILRTMDRAPTPDLKALNAFLDLIYVPQPTTGFEGIRKLEPGTALIFNGQSIETFAFGKLSSVPNTTRIGWEAACEKVEQLLKKSVHSQLVSDVPVGVFLSGGIDSSLVSAFAAQTSPESLWAFHLDWENSSGKQSELPYARSVANRYGLNLDILKINDSELMALLPKLVWHLEEPCADSAFVPTYLISRYARQKVKVIISGAGGDELFGGYPQHRTPSIAASLLKRALGRPSPSFSYFDAWSSARRDKLKEVFPKYELSPSRVRMDAKFRSFRTLGHARATMNCDLTQYLVDDILQLTDKMTMATSLECRVPFLDNELVDFARTLPVEYILNGNDSKRILRQLATKYLDAGFVKRPKEGFGAPFWEWIFRQRPRFDRLFAGGALEQNGLLHRKALAAIVAREDMGIYWRAFMLELWFRVHIHGENPDAIAL